MEKNEYRLVIDINDMAGGGAVSKSKLSSSSDADKYLKNAKNLVKYQVAQPFIQTTKQIVFNTVETNTGSSELTQRIQMGLNTAHTLANTVTYGANLGSMLGIGLGAGIGVAAAFTVGLKAVSILTRQIEINNRTKLENEQLSILRGRAGVQFNRSRGGE